MRKYLLILICLVSVATVAQAQSFKLGVKGGLNFSQLNSEDDLFDSKNRAGYQLGVWSRIGGAGLHVQPEVYYSGKNAKVTFNENGTDESGEVKFSNIDVPILLGTRFGIGPIAARLQAGPLFSFVVNQDNSFAEGIGATYKEAVNNYKNHFEAVVGGLGVDISNCTVDLRYEHGLGNIQKDKGKQTLNIWSLSVGYSLF